MQVTRTNAAGLPFSFEPNFSTANARFFVSRARTPTSHNQVFFSSPELNFGLNKDTVVQFRNGAILPATTNIDVGTSSVIIDVVSSNCGTQTYTFEFNRVPDETVCLDSDVINFPVVSFRTITGAAVPQITGKNLLVKESFETDGEGIRYDSNISFFNSNTQFFERTTQQAGFTQHDGAFYYGGRDTDFLSLNPSSVVFKPVSIENVKFIDISLLVGGGVGFQGDYMFLSYSIDGKAYVKVFDYRIRNNNAPFRLDTNGDGVGEIAGVPLITAAFTKAIANRIPVDGKEITFRFDMFISVAAAQLYFDDLIVTGYNSNENEVIVEQDIGNSASTILFPLFTASPGVTGLQYSAIDRLVALCGDNNKNQIITAPYTQPLRVGVNIFKFEIKSLQCKPKQWIFRILRKVNNKCMSDVGNSLLTGITMKMIGPPNLLLSQDISFATNTAGKGNNYKFTLNGQPIPNYGDVVQFQLQLLAGATATVTSNIADNLNIANAAGIFTISDLHPGINTVIVTVSKQDCLQKIYNLLIEKASNVYCIDNNFVRGVYLKQANLEEELIATTKNRTFALALSRTKKQFTPTFITAHSNIQNDNLLLSRLIATSPAQTVQTTPVAYKNTVFGRVFESTNGSVEFEHPTCGVQVYTQIPIPWQPSDKISSSYCMNNTLLDTITLNQETAAGFRVPASIKQFTIRLPMLRNSVSKLVISASTSLLEQPNALNIVKAVPTITPTEFVVNPGTNKIPLVVTTTFCGPVTYTVLVEKEEDVDLCGKENDILASVITRENNAVGNQLTFVPSLSIPGTREVQPRQKELSNSVAAISLGPFTIKKHIQGVSITELSTGNTLPIAGATSINLNAGPNDIRLVISSINCFPQTYTFDINIARIQICDKNNIISDIDVTDTSSSQVSFSPPIGTVSNQERILFGQPISNSITALTFGAPTFKNGAAISNKRVIVIDAAGTSTDITTTAAPISLLVGLNSIKVIATSLECSPFTYTFRIVRMTDPIKCGANDLLSSISIAQPSFFSTVPIVPPISTTGARTFVNNRTILPFETQVTFSGFVFTTNPKVGAITAKMLRKQLVSPFSDVQIQANINGASAFTGQIKTGTSVLFKLVVSSQFCKEQTYTFNITTASDSLQKRCSLYVGNNELFDLRVAEIPNLDTTELLSTKKQTIQTTATTATITTKSRTGATVVVSPAGIIPLAAGTNTITITVTPSPFCVAVFQVYTITIVKSSNAICGTKNNVLASFVSTPNIFPAIIGDAREIIAPKQNPQFPRTITFKPVVLLPGITFPAGNIVQLFTEIDGILLQTFNAANAMITSVSHGKDVKFRLVLRTVQCAPQTYTFSFSRQDFAPCAAIKNNVLQSVIVKNAQNVDIAVPQLGDSRNYTIIIPNRYNTDNGVNVNTASSWSVTLNTANGQIVNINNVLRNYANAPIVLPAPNIKLREIGDNVITITASSLQCKIQVYTFKYQRAPELKAGNLCGPNNDVLSGISFVGVTGIIPPLTMGVRTIKLADQASTASLIQITSVTASDALKVPVKATVQLNGNTPALLANPILLPLNFGDNKIVIRAFTRRCFIQSYTFTVKRNNNAAICGPNNDVLTTLPITASSGASIAFTESLPTTRKLTAKIKLSNCDTFITLGSPTLIAGTSNTKVETNSFPDKVFRLLNGNLQLPLIVGLNNLTVQVTTNECPVQTYAILIERKADTSFCNTDIMTGIVLKINNNAGDIIAVSPPISTTNARAFIADEPLLNSGTQLFVGTVSFNPQFANAKLFYVKSDNNLEQLVGNNQIPLNVGNNKLVFQLTSASCTTQLYTFSINRADGNVCGSDNDLLQSITIENKKNLQSLSLDRKVGEPGQRNFIATTIIQYESSFKLITFKNLLFNRDATNVKATLKVATGDIALGVATDISVVPGKNIFRIVIVADECPCQTYTFTVIKSSEFEKCGANNDVLQNIAVKTGTAGGNDVTFAPPIGSLGVRSFTATKPLLNSVTAIRFLQAGISFKDSQTAEALVTQQNGIASPMRDVSTGDKALDLKLGENNLLLTVITQFCKPQTYTFKVIRTQFQDCPQNFDVITQLTITRLVGGAANGLLTTTPSFPTANTRIYSATVKNCVSQITLSNPIFAPVVENGVASLLSSPPFTAGGNLAGPQNFFLDIGENEIKIQASSRTCNTQTYTFKITREPDENICGTVNDVLKAITITGNPGGGLFAGINLAANRAFTEATVQPSTVTNIVFSLTAANLETKNGISGHSAIVLFGTSVSVAMNIGGAPTSIVLPVAANNKFNVVVRTNQCKFQTYAFTISKSANAACNTGILASIQFITNPGPAAVTVNDATFPGPTTLLPATTITLAGLTNIANNVQKIWFANPTFRAFSPVATSQVTYKYRANANGPAVSVLGAFVPVANMETTDVGTHLYKLVATSAVCPPQTYTFQVSRQANGVCGATNDVVAAHTFTAVKGGEAQPISSTTAIAASVREFSFPDVDSQITHLNFATNTLLAGTTLRIAHIIPASSNGIQVGFPNQQQLSFGLNKIQLQIETDLCPIQTYTYNIKRLNSPSTACSSNLLISLPVTAVKIGGGAGPINLAVLPSPIVNSTRFLSTTTNIANNLNGIVFPATTIKRVGAGVTFQLNKQAFPQTVRVEPGTNNITFVATSSKCTAQTFTYQVKRQANNICGAANDVLTGLQLRALPASSVVAFQPMLTKVGAREFFVAEQENDVTGIQFENSRTFIPGITGGTMQNAQNPQVFTSAAFIVPLDVGSTTFIARVQTDQCATQTYTFRMSRKSSLLKCGAFSDLLLNVNVQAPLGDTIQFVPSIVEPNQRNFTATIIVPNRHSTVTFKKSFIFTLKTALTVKLFVIDTKPTSNAGTELALFEQGTPATGTDRTLPLRVGFNKYLVVAKSQSCATQTYTFTIQRAQAGSVCGSHNDLISAIVLKENSNTGAIIPLADVGKSGIRSFVATKSVANIVSKVFFSQITLTPGATAFYSDTGLQTTVTSEAPLVEGENIINLEVKSIECPVQHYQVRLTRTSIASICGQFNDVLQGLSVRSGSINGELFSFQPFVGEAGKRHFIAETSLSKNIATLYFGNTIFRNGIGSPTASIIGTNEILPETFQISSGSKRDVIIVVKSSLCPVQSYTFSVSRDAGGIGTVASSLVVAVQPGQALINDIISPQPIIQLSDSSGTIVPMSKFSTTAQLHSGTGAIVGNVTLAFTNGTATFKDIKFTLPGRKVLKFITKTADIDVDVLSQEFIICPSNSIVNSASKAGCLCKAAFKDIDAQETSVSCTPCEPGTFTIGGNSITFGDAAHVCIAQCPAGYKDINNNANSVNCVACSNNTFNSDLSDSTAANDLASKCQQCPINSESGITSATCHCKKGFKDVNTTKHRVNCVACLVNQYSNGGDSITANDVPSRCIACPSNSGSLIGPKSKLSDCICNARYGRSNSNSNNSICAICEPGKSSTDNDDTCILCLPGTFSSSIGSTSCLPCPINTFSSNSGATSCNDCPNGFTSTSSSTNCTKAIANCNPGFGIANTNTNNSSTTPICVQCIENHFSLGGISPCKACSIGKISSKGSTVCIDDTTYCFAGNGFVPSQSICIPCKAGFKSIGGIKANCIPCDAGSYSTSSTTTTTSSTSTIGSSNCTLCPIGKFSTQQAATSISSCIDCTPFQVSTATRAYCDNNINNPEPPITNNNNNIASIDMNLILPNKKKRDMNTIINNNTPIANAVRVALANCVRISTRYIAITNIKDKLLSIKIFSVPNGLSAASIATNLLVKVNNNDPCIKNTAIDGATIFVITNPTIPISTTTPSSIVSSISVTTQQPSPASPISASSSSSTIVTPTISISPIPSVPTASPLTPNTSSSSSSSRNSSNTLFTYLVLLLSTFILLFSL